MGALVLRAAEARARDHARVNALLPPVSRTRAARRTSRLPPCRPPFPCLGDEAIRRPGKRAARPTRRGPPVSLRPRTARIAHGRTATRRVRPTSWCSWSASAPAARVAPTALPGRVRGRPLPHPPPGRDPDGTQATCTTHHRRGRPRAGRRPGLRGEHPSSGHNPRFPMYTDPEQPQGQRGKHPARCLVCVMRSSPHSEADGRCRLHTCGPFGSVGRCSGSGSARSSGAGPHPPLTPPSPGRSRQAREP